MTRYESKRTPSQVNTGQQGKTGLDAFGDLLGGSDDSKASSPSLSLGSSVKVGSEAMSAQMKAKIMALQRSAQGEQTVASDDRMHVTAIKAYAGDRTIIALCITNKSSSNLSNVELKLSGINGFTAGFDGEPAIKAGMPGATGLCIVPAIAAAQTAVVLVGLQCRDASAAAVTAMSASLTPAGSSSSTSFSVPLSIADVLRAAPMSTPQYGGFWKQHGSEQKFQIKPTSVKASQEYMARIKAENVAPVETIGVENIAAAKLVSGSTVNLYCFVHAKLTAAASQLDVTVRSGNAEFTAAVARHLASVLK
jgi:hypothetical protein